MDYMDSSNTISTRRSSVDEPLLDHSSNFAEPPRGIVVIGFVLFMTLGIAPQLVQNALFSETPIFLLSAPEKEDLSAYIITAFMLANIFCLLYLIAQQVFRLSDTLFIYIILLGNIGLSILIIVFWNRSQTVPLLGTASLPLLILSFFAGALGNTSTLVFFAFASHYLPIFTTAMSTGYGISGVISSMLSIVQNPDNPRFSVGLFFALMIIILLLCFGIFIVISRTELGAKLKIEPFDPYVFDTNISPNDILRENVSSKVLLRYSYEAIMNMLWLSLITFWIPAIIPFLTPTKSHMSYMNAIFLVLPPIGAAITGFYKFYKITLISMIETVIFLLILFPVFHPTHPVFGIFPVWLLFILMIVFSLLSGYNSTMIYLSIRKDLAVFDPISIEKVSRWAAFANQIGAMCGSFGTDGFLRARLYVKH